MRAKARYRTPYKRRKGPGVVNPHGWSGYLTIKILILTHKEHYQMKPIILTLWKVSLKGKAFTLDGMPPGMAVAAAMAAARVVVVIGGPGAGTGFSKKKLEKSSKRRGKISLVKISGRGAVEGLPILNTRATKA